MHYWSHVRERTLLVQAAVIVGVVGETKTRRRRTVRLLLPLALHAPEPYASFVCQDDDQRDRFLYAADYDLTGHHDCLDYNHDRFVGRTRILVAAEQDMHAGRLDAWRVPAVPRDALEPRQALHVGCVGLTVGS